MLSYGNFIYLEQNDKKNDEFNRMRNNILKLFFQITKDAK